MSGGGVRVSIPSNVRKTIQNIKEITGHHSEEEIYAMLRECSMDPNETAQRLLFQDPFHEVRRKRDRKKENVNNKESGDSRWRPGMQGRGNRGGRANFSPRNTSHDAGGGRNSGSGKDNGTNQDGEKGAGSSFPAFQEKSKETTPITSSAAVVANVPTGVVSGSTSAMLAPIIPAGSVVSQKEVTSSPVSVDELESAVSPVDADKAPAIAFGTSDTCGEPMPSSSNSSVSGTPASSSNCFSLSDPVPMPSNDLRLPGMVGIIKCEVGSHRTVGESNAVISAEKAASEIGNPVLHGKMPSKSQGVGKSHLSEPSQPSSATIHGSSADGRPPSNYSSRSQQIIGPQKAGSNKEWKPKPTTSTAPVGSGTAGSSDIPNILPEASTQSRPVSGVLDSEEATSKLQKKLEELHLPQRQHVIIPNHIQVPESERTKLSFGSFDASLGITSSCVGGPESEKSSTPVSETSQGIEETVEEQAASDENSLENAEEGVYLDHLQSPSHALGNIPGDNDVSFNAVSDCNESKQDGALLSGGHQYSVIHTSPSHSFGFMPPMLGSQISAFQNSESQARDVSCLPSFIGGNSLVLSTAGPTPLVTQAAGLMQSSIAMTQQPVSVFRPPTGLHISHYPPSYIPYPQYFSPFYVPPPGIHQFLGNGAFPQQPQAGSVYPTPPVAAAPGVKYPIPHYKSGANTGNSTQIGIPSGYGPYGSSPAGYNPSSAATGGNSTANDDLGASQFKENNVYITGQQSEGSAVWIAASGRDMSSLPSLPTGSFYNLTPQGQRVTFASTQAGHGTFASIYHPGQAATAAAVYPLLQ